MINKIYKNQLIALAKLDQKLRRVGIVDRKIDEKNLLAIKKLIKKYGWPDFSNVGKKGSQSAWLIIQHADFDVKFQSEFLKIIEESIKKKLFDKLYYPYLYDRVCVNLGKKQLYGTQFYSKNGKLAPRPIKDKKNINKRRKLFGLPAFETNKTKM